MHGRASECRGERSFAFVLWMIEAAVVALIECRRGRASIAREATKPRDDGHRPRGDDRLGGRKILARHHLG